jgi:hypothetical protein
LDGRPRFFVGRAWIFLGAFFDSPVVSLPETNDLVPVMLVTQNRVLMPAYVTMATLVWATGSLLP